MTKAEILRDEYYFKLIELQSNPVVEETLAMAKACAIKEVESNCKFGDNLTELIVLKQELIRL